MGGVWVLLVLFENAHGKYRVAIIDDEDGNPQVFPTLQAAKECAKQQPICIAHGALAVEVAVGSAVWL